MGQNVGKDKKEVWKPIYQKRLGDAINYAKGKQSMAVFARKCGLNPMTLSRAVNGTIKKPLDEETIRIMAECSDAPTEDVFEYLMRANGYLKDDNEERRRLSEQRRQERKDRFDTAQGIIMRALFESGYTIIPVINTKLEALDPTLKKSRFRIHTNVGFALKVQGFEPSFRNYTVNIFTGEDLADGVSYETELRDEQYFLMERYKDVFLRAVWEPEAFENCQYSIVFLNRDLFEGFLKDLEGLKFNSCFSLILLDLAGQKVLREVFLPRKKGRKDKSLFKFTDRGEG